MRINVRISWWFTTSRRIVGAPARPGALPKAHFGVAARNAEVLQSQVRTGLLADAESRKYLVQNFFYPDGASQPGEYMAGTLQLGGAEFRLMFSEGVIEVRQNITKACAMPRAGEAGGAAPIR